MTDHVARMVHSWFERARQHGNERDATDHLINSIHRLIREAEQQTRQRCEEVALRTASQRDAEQVALAIRALGAQSGAAIASED